MRAPHRLTKNATEPPSQSGRRLRRTWRSEDLLGERRLVVHRCLGHRLAPAHRTDAHQHGPEQQVAEGDLRVGGPLDLLGVQQADPGQRRADSRGDRRPEQLALQDEGDDRARTRCRPASRPDRARAARGRRARRWSATPRRARAALVPAAARALSISPAPQAARLGMIAATTAAACSRGYGLERLGADQQPDVEQDRHDRRQRQHRPTADRTARGSTAGRSPGRWPSSSSTRPPASFQPGWPM